MKTKYPIKVANQFYPAGTEVRQATLAEMQQQWPGIVMRRGSPQAGVWFPDLAYPTIIHTSQLDGHISSWNDPSGQPTPLRCGAGEV